MRRRPRRGTLPGQDRAPHAFVVPRTGYWKPWPRQSLPSRSGAGQLWFSILGARDRRLLRAADPRLARVARSRLAGRPDVDARRCLSRWQLWEDLVRVAPNRFVYDFDEPSDGRSRAARRQGHRAGGDDAARRARPGRVHDHDRRLPRVHGERRRSSLTGSRPRSSEHLAALEEKTGKRFGDADDPLLVSVRSGAAVSMPGMMDTILNLGLNDEAVRGLAERTGNPRFANDSYRRLIQMYGEVVDGVDGHLFEEALSKLKDERGADARRRPVRRGPGRARRDLQGDLRGRDGRGVPAGRPRAAVTRRPRGLRVLGQPARPGLPAGAPHPRRPRHGRATSSRWSSATRATQSGTGVAFTRDPSTGEPGLYGEFLADAQGEDVVAGIRTPEPLARMQDVLPEAFEQLVDDDAAPRGALPRHAGHRVHRRGREALPAPDAQREADGRGRAEGRRGHGRRGPDLARGRRRAHRSRAARPAPAPDDRPERRASRSSRRA